MGIASLHRKTKGGHRAPWNHARSAAHPNLYSDSVSSRKAGCLLSIPRFASNLTYNYFEAFLWEVKRGFRIPVSSSCYGSIHASALKDSASGCAARTRSAA